MKDKNKVVSQYNDMLFLDFSAKEVMKFEIIPNKHGKDWYLYGEDDLFTDRLEYLSNHSALHNAILSSKVDHLCGLGLDSDDKKTKKLLERANPYESYDDIYRKAANDLTLYGGFALDIVYGKGHKVITDVYHIPFNKLRIGNIDNYGNITELWYSNDWKNYRKEGNKPVKKSVYSKDNKEPSQIMYVKPYRSGVSLYPLPTYIGALEYINIDSEVATFHLAHLQNGMFPSVMINFNNGVPTDDKKAEIYKKFQEKFQGSAKAGTFMLNWSDDASKAATIIPVSAGDLDKQFIQLNDMILQNILSGHKIVSPLLVGIKTEGQLGGANELANAYQIYMTSVIEPLKTLILNPINEIIAFNGGKEVFVIKSSPIKFLFSETVLQGILSKDEMREIIGYEALQIGEQKETPLIEILGIGGTQALQSILADATMSPEVKRGILSVIFGLSEEQINKMIIITPTE